MSIGSLVGLGYSGYAYLNRIPLLTLPSSAPENENMIKSAGAFSPDPTDSMGELPAKQKRSLNLSLATVVTPRTWYLLKPLMYGWRMQGLIDQVLETPYIYSYGGGEKYEGSGYVDEVTLTASPESFLTMTFNLTAWNWSESSVTPGDSGTPVIDPFNDPMYKPIPGWNTTIVTSALTANSIVSNFSLRLANNWNYQTFLAAYAHAPNPALITVGNLDASLNVSWYAARSDHPYDSGWFQIKIADDGKGSFLDVVYIDSMVREPRQFDGVGNPDQMIQWNTTYFGKGKIPRSN